MPIVAGQDMLAADVVEVREHTFMAIGDRMTSLALAVATTAVEGTGVATMGEASCQLSTGATAAGRAYLHFSAIYGLNPGSSSGLINWDKDFHLRFTILRQTTSANAISRVQLKTALTDTDLASDGIGIVIKNYQIYAESYNTARQETDTTITMVDLDEYTIDIVHTAGTDVKFYVNGTLMVTHAVAANVPAGENTANLIFSIDNQTDNITTYLRVGACISLWQEE